MSDPLVMAHNQAIAAALKRGDLVKFKRRNFDHPFFRLALGTKLGSKADIGDHFFMRFDRKIACFRIKFRRHIA